MLEVVRATAASSNSNRSRLEPLIVTLLEEDGEDQQRQRIEIKSRSGHFLSPTVGGSQDPIHEELLQERYVAVRLRQ